MKCSIACDNCITCYASNKKHNKLGSLLEFDNVYCRSSKYTHVSRKSPYIICKVTIYYGDFMSYKVTHITAGSNLNCLKS